MIYLYVLHVWLYELCAMSFWCFFFFFKQKTAYEMRISDWSSDVCSSDLTIPETSQPLTVLFHRPRPGGEIPGSGDNPNLTLILPAEEIGRASCRERVCQYV